MVLSEQMRAALDFYQALGARLPETPRWGEAEWLEMTRAPLLQSVQAKVIPRAADNGRGDDTGRIVPVQRQSSKPVPASTDWSKTLDV